MSYEQKQEAGCACGERFDVYLWDSVNVTQDPDLKEMILNGEMNIAICPRCSVIFYVEKQVLYHDEEKKRMWYVYPHDWEGDRGELKRKCLADVQQVETDLHPGRKLQYDVAIFFGMDELLKVLEQEEFYTFEGLENKEA